MMPHCLRRASLSLAIVASTACATQTVSQGANAQCESRVAAGGLREFRVDSIAEERPDSPGMLYPDSLSARGVRGTVRVSFVVDTAGRVDPTTVRVLEATDSALVAPVRSGVAALSFRPAFACGRRVKQLVERRYQFGA